MGVAVTSVYVSVAALAVTHGDWVSAMIAGGIVGLYWLVASGRRKAEW
jgi:hypothetical protein